jgi:hypothetical protein
MGYKGSKGSKPKVSNSKFFRLRGRSKSPPARRRVVIIERHGNTIPRVSLFPKENRCCPLPTRARRRGTEAPTQKVKAVVTP